MTDLTPRENASLDIAVTRLGQLVEKMEKAAHPYPRERTWPDAEAELEQAKAEIERLRRLLRECLDNDAATSIVEYDPSVPGSTRTAWSADNWNKRVREALGE